MSFHPFIISARNKIEISSPQDFSHQMHVGFNQETGEFIVSLFMALKLRFILYCLLLLVSKQTVYYYHY